MITFIDVNKSVNEELKVHFPSIRVHSSDFKEGFKKPTFFTKIVPLAIENESLNLIHYQIMVTVNYFNGIRGEGRSLDYMEVEQKLRESFGMTLSVGDRELLLKNIRSDTVDGVFQFRFDLEYYTNNKLVDKKDYELMREVNVELERK